MRFNKTFQQPLADAQNRIMPMTAFLLVISIGLVLYLPTPLFFIG